MKNYHYVKEDDSWKLKEENSKRASKVFETKSEGLKEIPDFVKGQGGGSVKIHKENGRIQEERTYPRKIDPRRSKG